MGAGDSARSVAERARRSADVHRKKADAAEKVAACYEAGERGEKALDGVVAGLTERGWWPLSDRRSPTGGNLDELLVGPRGVAVLDAKTWSDSVRVEGDRFFGGRHRRTDHIDKLIKQVKLVEGSLDRTGFDDVPAQGFIVLTGALDRSYRPTEVRGVWVLGLDHVRSGFEALPSVLPMETVSAVKSALVAAFPPCGEEVLADGPPPPPGEWDFEKSIRFVYAHTWRRLRVYLNAPDGADLGWRDLRNDALVVSCSGDDALIVASLLKRATASGIRMSGEDLPRVASGGAAGTQNGLGRVPAWVSVLLGWEGRDRLYGTLLVPGKGTFPLGHIRMLTRAAVPLVEGPLGPDFGSSAKYLRLLRERWPEERSRRVAMAKGQSRFERAV